MFKIDAQAKKALSLVGTIVVIATLLFLAGCSYFNKQMDLPDDHPAEQLLEEVLDAVIHHETGIDPNIDLTPEESK